MICIARSTLIACAMAAGVASLSAHNQIIGPSGIRHVLLISIDGMHALDYLNCSHGANGGQPYCPNLAALGGPASTIATHYSPEINSTVVPLPGIQTVTGVSSSPIPDPSQTGAWTDSFANVQCYDTLSESHPEPDRWEDVFGRALCSRTEYFRNEFPGGKRRAEAH